MKKEEKFIGQSREIISDVLTDIEKIQELNEYLDYKDESSNILTRVVDLEKKLYDECVIAEANLKKNLLYLRYINNLYKSIDEK